MAAQLTIIDPDIMQNKTSSVKPQCNKQHGGAHKKDVKRNKSMQPLRRIGKVRGNTWRRGYHTHGLVSLRNDWKVHHLN